MRMCFVGQFVSYTSDSRCDFQVLYHQIQPQWSLWSWAVSRANFLWESWHICRPWPFMTYGKQESGTYFVFFIHLISILKFVCIHAGRFVLKRWRVLMKMKSSQFLLLFWNFFCRCYLLESQCLGLHWNLNMNLMQIDPYGQHSFDFCVYGLCAQKRQERYVQL